MANLYITSTAKFNPFTFDEMLKPALMATEAHRELEDLYSSIDDASEGIGGKINPNTEKETYTRYKNFEDSLRQEVDTLANEGLNPGSRRKALDLKKRYTRDIAPIEEQYKRREELAKEQRAGRLNDDTIMYDNDFSRISLDEMLKNPSMSYSAVSGNTLYKQGMQAAASASARNIETLKALGNQYWQIKQGYGRDAANAFLLDHAKIPELNEAIDRIISQSGVTDNNKSRAIDYTISGLMDGLSYGENYQANRAYISPAEAQRLAMERERLDMAREQQSWAREQKEDERLGIKLPDGTRVKPIGGGRVLVTQPNGKWEVKTASTSSTSTSDALTQASKISDTPIIVARTGGKWHSAKEGQDAKGVLFGMTRSNLVSGWGNYTLDNVDSMGIPVASINEIPSEAAREIKKAIKDNNLDIEEYTILQVPAESNRAGGSFDYVLMPKDQVDIDAASDNMLNEGL